MNKLTLTEETAIGTEKDEQCSWKIYKLKINLKKYKRQMLATQKRKKKNKVLLK